MKYMTKINNDIKFKMFTPFRSFLSILNPVTSTLPTKSSKTINTHQFSFGKLIVVNAKTNNNNTPIIILKMRVNTTSILKILIKLTIR